jgi:hypothetical protein
VTRRHSHARNHMVVVRGGHFGGGFRSVACLSAARDRGVEHMGRMENVENVENVESAVLRSAQLASLAISSLLQGMQRVTGERPDVAAWQAQEETLAEETTRRVRERHIRPSVLSGPTRVVFSVAGVVLAKAPPRIRDACIGGVYESLSSMHVDHLRTLLEKDAKYSGVEHGDVKAFEKRSRDAREALGVPEGAQTASPERLLAKLAAGFRSPSSETGAEGIEHTATHEGIDGDAPAFCAALASQATSALIAASRTL